MPKILIIEDDAAIRTAVAVALTERGHEVSGVASALEGLQRAVADKPDAVLLDLGLPDLSGREVLRMLRAVSEVPVIVVTARGAESDMVRALEAGADDYVVKPFGAAQIHARITAVLRRGGAGPEPEAVRVGGLLVNPRRRQAWLDGRLLDLTPREFDLLYYLAARRDDVVSKQTLLVDVWHTPYTNADKTVDVHLSWLRRKLGETAQHPRYLHTIRRVGVRLSAPAPGPQSESPGPPR